MSSLLNPLLKLPASLVETGLLSLNSALKTAQRTLDSVTGQPRLLPMTAPSVVLRRAIRLCPISPLVWPEFSAIRVIDNKEIGHAHRPRSLAAARKSFSYVDFTDPRNVGFPAQVALSVGTLAVQSALRGLATYEMAGPTRRENSFAISSRSTPKSVSSSGWNTAK